MRCNKPENKKSASSMSSRCVDTCCTYQLPSGSAAHDMTTSGSVVIDWPMTSRALTCSEAGRDVIRDSARRRVFLVWRSHEPSLDEKARSANAIRAGSSRWR